MGEQKTSRPPRKEAKLTKRKSFRVDPELMERFRHAAALDGRSVDGAVRFAILEYSRTVEARHSAQPMSKGIDDDGNTSKRESAEE